MLTSSPSRNVVFGCRIVDVENKITIYQCFFVISRLPSACLSLSVSPHFLYFLSAASSLCVPFLIRLMSKAIMYLRVILVSAQVVIVIAGASAAPAVLSSHSFHLYSRYRVYICTCVALFVFASSVRDARASRILWTRPYVQRVGRRR